MKLTIENVIVFLVSVMFLFILILVVQNLKHNFIKEQNQIKVDYFFKDGKLFLTGLLSKRMKCNIILRTINSRKLVIYNKTMSSFGTYFRFNFTKSSSDSYNYTLVCCSVTNDCINISKSFISTR